VSTGVQANRFGGLKYQVMVDAGACQEFERSTSRHGFAGRRRKRTLNMGQTTLAPGNRGVSLPRSAPPFGRQVTSPSNCAG